MVHVKPLTLEGFTQIISHPKCNLMLIFPERLRYNYIFENVFILQDHWKKQILFYDSQSGSEKSKHFLMS